MTNQCIRCQKLFQADNKLQIVCNDCFKRKKLRKLYVCGKCNGTGQLQARYRLMTGNDNYFSTQYVECDICDEGVV